MAERRMFAKSIVLSDAFLDMPLSARCLYFTLGMLADDDGFVGNPKSIMRQCGASQDDMLVLLQKRYILGFESGVIVIKHWRMNNYLRNDRYHTTTYLEEKEELRIDERGAYTEKDKFGYAPTLIDENSIEETTSDNDSSSDMSKEEADIPTGFLQMVRNAFVGQKCPICGVKMSYEYNTTKPTIQHNVPISKGGKNEISNLSVICLKCNTSIKNREETPPYNNKEIQMLWKWYTEYGYTEVRLGKDSIGKDSIVYPPISPTGDRETKPKKETQIQLFRRLRNDYNLSYPLQETIEEWLKYKTEMKKIYKETGLKQLLNKFVEAEQNYGSQKVIEVVNDTMANGYQGIVWDWLTKSNKPKENKQQRDLFAELRDC